MAKRSVFDFSTAYAQLILLVFLPICVLAGVGTVLVFHETSRAARVEQRAIADTAFSQYTAQIYILQAKLAQLQTTQQQLNLAELTPNASPANEKVKANLSQNLTQQQQILTTALQHIIQNRHILGIAVVNAQAIPLVSSGNWHDDSTANATTDLNANITPTNSTLNITQNAVVMSPTAQAIFKENMPRFIQSDSPIDTELGTFYAKKLDLNAFAISTSTASSTAISNTPNATVTNDPDNAPHSAATPLWLIVNVDDEPLKLARYQVMFALAITGLFTILLLLLSLNSYARRWIAPIYEMRLYLQRTHASSLYQPMNVVASGELNQLQQDLVKTFRRLHTSFQELKNHAEETEDDLRLAFDEMEMQNISIRNARDAAVSASQTKSAFLANISHELRTPLNSIDGFINLLSRNAGLSAEQNLYVETIRKSSAHLLALVNDVLDFSKIEAGKLVLDRHDFDLYASIYDVADMLSPLAAEKGLRLAVIFYDDVPRFLEGDALRIKQVLTNLVNNAIKFTDIGEVIVRVSLDAEDDDRVMIEVTDTGKGVDADKQGILFQSFSQGDPSITRQYGGTGLGLVISKQLTQMMGGSIGFFANGSKSSATGSTFWFTLPIRLSASQACSQKDLPELSDWHIPVGLSEQGLYQGGVRQDGKIHILIWLSHPASLQVFKGSLNRMPVVISVQDSLTGLLEVLKTQGNQWDWVVVDNEAADTVSLLKQIRLHYAGKLALFGYQLNLNTEIIARYQAQALFEPLDRRQLYQILGNESPQTTEKPIPKWQGYRVLAVDDHAPNLLVLEALLAELSIEVACVNSGYEAIEYIRQHQDQIHYRVDLIFMDIQMPRLSGQEAAQQIRQIEPYDFHVPIIALTAHSLSDERDSLLAAGIDDYVGKPISQVQLLQILQKWLGSQSGHGNIATVEHDNSKVMGTNTTDDSVKNPTIVKLNQSNAETPETKPKASRSTKPMTPKQNQNTLPTYFPSQTQLDMPSNSPAVQPKTELAVIDWEDALMRAAGKSDLAANLMMMLIDSIDTEKADLATAWADKDRQALANIAHRILGASRYTGVPALRQASQDFEDKCLLNVQNQSPAQFAQLQPYFDQLITALDTLQNLDLSAWPPLYYYRLNEQDMAWKMI